MKYHFTKNIAKDFDKVVEMLDTELSKEGFGIVTKMDLKDKFKDKLNIDYKNYLILGACNPLYAYKALEVENKLGTMLPCNFVIQDEKDGEVSISAINPMVAMQEIDNPALEKISIEISSKIIKILENIE